jgi:sigma-B regulation protein RsbU (phosphoserine phosphatase)
MADLLVPEHRRERHRRAFAQYLETGRATILGRRLEMEGLRADGTVFPVELAITHVPVPGPALFTAYLRDITERQRSEEERESLLARERRAREEVEAAFEALQRTLLPPALPTIPGVEIGGMHRAAGPGSLVGGDFYDVFQTEPHGWGVAIGDVCGRGTKAAALTALSRYTLRAAAMATSRPSEVLATLNEAVLRDESEAQFCTAVFARLRPDQRAQSFELSIGGHPPPLVLRSDGTVERLQGTGMLLGVLPRPSLSDQRIELRSGETLLLYTDGVTETRTAHGFLEIEGLERLLPVCQGLDAGTLIDRLGGHVDGLRRGPPRDDMALLAVRATPPV